MLAQVLFHVSRFLKLYVNFLEILNCITFYLYAIACINSTELVNEFTTEDYYVIFYFISFSVIPTSKYYSVFGKLHFLDTKTEGDRSKQRTGRNGIRTKTKTAYDEVSFPIVAEAVL